MARPKNEDSGVDMNMQMRLSYYVQMNLRELYINW